MIRIAIYLITLMVHHSLIQPSGAVIYTYEDVELRRIFPSEFPQDTIRKSGSVDAEHLGRYEQLQHYFNFPKSPLNSHFEELTCYERRGKKICRIDTGRYSWEENQYFNLRSPVSHIDRRRVYCIFLICFNEDELDRLAASF